MSDMADREDVLVLLASMPESFSDFLVGVDESAASYRHGPAFPTVGELVAHVADSAAAADAILRGAEDAPRSWQSPPAAGGERTVDEALRDYRRVRRRTMDLLREWQAKDWSRTVDDARDGEVDMIQLCTAISAHETAHLVQARNLVSLPPEQVFRRI